MQAFRRAQERAREWARIGRARQALELWPERWRGEVRHQDLSGNATFRVRTPERELLALRIYRPGRWSARDIQQEHDFMRFLGPDLGVVPPLAGRDGETLQRLEDGGYAALFRWVPGRSVRVPPTSRQLVRAGEHLARLHDRARAFRGEEPRHLWDREQLLHRTRRAIELEWDWHLPHLPRPLLVEPVEQVLALWSRLGPREGYLHGDFHWGNLKLHRGRVLPLDFDDCGFGPLAWDLAVLLYLSEPTDLVPRPLDPILAGYNRVAGVAIRPLEVLLFLWIRYLYVIRWIFERRELYTEEELEGSVEYHLECMADLEPRLFYRGRRAVA